MSILNNCCATNLTHTLKARHCLLQLWNNWSFAQDWEKDIRKQWKKEIANCVFTTCNDLFYCMLHLGANIYLFSDRSLNRSIRLRLTQYFRMFNPRDHLIQEDTKYHPISFRNCVEKKLMNWLNYFLLIILFCHLYRFPELDAMEWHVTFKLLPSSHKEFFYDMPRSLLSLQFEIEANLDQNHFALGFLKFY